MWHVIATLRDLNAAAAATEFSQEESISVTQ
jgi:hypothetical protein